MTSKSTAKPAFDSAQVIPFPTAAKKSNRALDIAIGKIDRALDEQLVVIRQFRESMATLGAIFADIKNTQRRTVAALGAAERGMRGVTVQSQTLAGSMEVCERLLRSGRRV